MLTEHDALVEQTSREFVRQWWGPEHWDIITDGMKDDLSDAFETIIPIIRTTDAARIAALEAALTYIAKQWPDSSAAKHARATLRSNTNDR